MNFNFTNKRVLFECNHCGQPFKLPSSSGNGFKLKCPDCGGQTFNGQEFVAPDGYNGRRVICNSKRCTWQWSDEYNYICPNCGHQGNEVGPIGAV